MLTDRNGRPYRAVGSVQIFDPENQEHDLLHFWDQEMIKQMGSPIEYYEVFIQKGTVDPLYAEDRGKIFSNVPIQLWGFYDPQPPQNFQNQFGIDSPDEMKFQFNVRAVLAAVGHLPKVGSRLFTPHKRENWKIIQRNLSEYKLWGELRLELICERFQETITTGEGRITNPQPDFTLH